MPTFQRLGMQVVIIFKKNKPKKCHQDAINQEQVKYTACSLNKCISVLIRDVHFELDLYDHLLFHIIPRYNHYLTDHWQSLSAFRTVKQQKTFLVLLPSHAPTLRDFSMHLDQIC